MKLFTLLRKLFLFMSTLLFREELKTHNFLNELICEDYKRAIIITLHFARIGDKLNQRNDAIFVITAF